MPRYYFAYGSEGQDFHGGWTVVEAPSREAACELFRMFHKDTEHGLLNCGGIYTEKQFKETQMYREGNFGARCHEKIYVERALYD